MYRIRFLIEKEFKQIFRNTILLRIMVGAPIMQLVALSYAANFEVKNLVVAVVDHDHTTYAQRLVGKFRYIENFRFAGYVPAYKQAYQQLLAGEADLVLVIPPHFERDLGRTHQATLQLMVNAIDGSKAGIAAGYAQSIIRDFNENIRAETMAAAEAPQRTQLDVRGMYWYNPRLEYRTFMVPGILFELLLLIGGLIAALNIVREKEIGTQEQLNVTPIRKHEFILGKLIPFVIIGMGQFTIGLAVGVFLFKVPIVGSILLLYAFALLFLLVSVGLGLLISTAADTQQQATFLVFFCLVLFILLSGLFSSTDDMPAWAQVINTVNPLRYVIEAGRNIMLKGSTLPDVQLPFVALLGIAGLLLFLATWRFRKTS